MNAERFNWKEMAQLVGGIAAVALLQVGLLFPDTRDFIGSWVVLGRHDAIRFDLRSDRRRNDQQIRGAAGLVKDELTRPNQFLDRDTKRRSSGS